MKTAGDEDGERYQQPARAAVFSPFPLGSDARILGSQVVSLRAASVAAAAAGGARVREVGRNAQEAVVSISAPFPSAVAERNGFVSNGIRCLPLRLRRSRRQLGKAREGSKERASGRGKDRISSHSVYGLFCHRFLSEP
jgi:hypothetical protein